MKTLFKILLIGAALVLLLALLGGLALLHHGADMHVVLNDEEMPLGSLGHWLGASIGLFTAAVICLVVMPLVLLLGVALPLLIVGGVLGGVLMALLGVGAVVGSPLVLLGLLLFVVLRNRRRAADAARATHV